MLSIKIEIGLNKDHIDKKGEPDIKKAVLLAALLDSAVWIADTVLLLKFFYSIPLYPYGIYFIFCVFLMYLVYFIIKTRYLIKKYGKEVYREEFGQSGTLLVAASAVLLFFLLVTFCA
ncbi:MAG: hypothetical protein K2N90_12310 [Lachnospiraceae bacterium]|nr:hypothetical protein [Lachnospiraceae bacterium]